jgi:hypothetical protein
MKKLTLDMLNEINQCYDYNYSENKVITIFKELANDNVVCMDDIFEEFELIAEQNLN